MNELMAHAYTKTHGLKSTGLRFFTVYGPWGRPDMAYFKFSERLLSKQPIALHAGGEMIRDFTYIDDIVEVIFRFVDKETDKQEAEASLASSSIFNIGKGAPELVTDMLRYLERFLDTRGIYEAVSKESSEPYATHADTARLEEYIGYRPVVDLEEGMRRFVQWYVDYYKIKNGPDIKSRDL
jgi:UDP-glucuronate 4-epimerase